jgi:hypothetical protein
MAQHHTWVLFAIARHLQPPFKHRRSLIPKRATREVKMP